MFKRLLKWLVRQPGLPVYYAHSLRIYSTKQESKEIKQIRRCWHCQVVNPRTTIPQHLSSAEAMGVCLNTVRTLPVLVFSEYDGYIGRGVFDEVLLAQKMGKPVYLLRAGKFYDEFTIHETGPSWVCYASVILVKEARAR